MKFYLSKLILFLKFIFFPKLIAQKERVLYGDSVRVDFKGVNLPLLISFAGLGEEFNFGKTLGVYRVNVIYLRDLNHNWYVNGIPDAGNTVAEVARFLVLKIEEIRPSKVVMLGVSAGGFAALLYGCLLHADAILAFSPQTFMNRLNCVVYLDYRWLDRVVQIYGGDKTNRDFLDIKMLIIKSKVPVSLIYDSTHRLDNLHSKRITGPHVKHVTTKGGGHTLVQEIRASGLLTKLVEEAIQPG